MMRWVFVCALMAGCSAPETADVRGALSRAVIDGSAQPLMLAELPQRGMSATLVPVGMWEDVTTWRTAQRQTLTFRDGVLIATRGLGDDLMDSDVGGTIAALAGGPRVGYLRRSSYLDGEGRRVPVTLRCRMDDGQSVVIASFELAVAASLHVETCETGQLTVQNRYWVGANGAMRRSEQWVGSGIGMLFTEHLTR